MDAILSRLLILAFSSKNLSSTLSSIVPLTLDQMPSQAYKLSYGERAKAHSNLAAKQLLETMERKKTNLCVSVDTVKPADFLAIIDAVGPYTCLIKANIPLAYHQCHAFDCSLHSPRPTSTSWKTLTTQSSNGSRFSPKSTTSSSSRTENSLISVLQNHDNIWGTDMLTRDV